MQDFREWFELTTTDREFMALAGEMLAKGRRFEERAA